MCNLDRTKVLEIEFAPIVGGRPAQTLVPESSRDTLF